MSSSNAAYPHHIFILIFWKRACISKLFNVPIDNSATERAIRPFTIGRANWHIIDTVHGAEASAIIYSLVETAKANKLKIYEYLKHLLTEIPKHMDGSDRSFLDDLLPWSDKLPEECRKKI